jgi:hypothetical protein
VYIRGCQERVEALGDTIRHLRDAVAAFLDTAEARLQEQAQAIRIFGNDSSAELNDASPLTTTVQYTYTAFEVFTTVPTDLFRSVKLTAIHPAVDSDPGNSNGFTRVSPLFCATLTPLESEDPPFYMQGGRVMVRGASLQCDDTSIPAATVRPADDMTATEPPLTRIVLDDIVFKGTYDVNTEIGVLHTSYIYKYFGSAPYSLFPGSSRRHAQGMGLDRKSVCFLALRDPSRN